MSQISLIKPMVISTLLILSPNLVLAQSSAEPSGSEEGVEKTSLSFTDPVTKQSVTIFEAVTNKIALNKKPVACDELRYYVSPLFFFEIGDVMKKPVFDRDQDLYLYSVRMNYFHDGMRSKALDYIGKPGNCEIKPTQVSNLYPSRAVNFDFPDLKSGSVAVKPIGVGDTRIVLPETSDVNVRVNKAQKDFFEELVANGSIRYEARTFYNTKKLKLEYIGWTVEDVTGNEAYKKLDQGGGNYFSADQVQNVMREVAAKAGLFKYKDPGLEEQFSNKLNGLFESFLSKATEQLLNSKDDVKALENELRNSLNINAKDYQPLTLLWDVAEAVKTIDDYSEANKVLDDKRTREKESFKASASGGYGPFSGSVSYGKETENWTHKRFEDEKAFRNFKDKMVEGKGKEAKVVMRGLKLLDKTTFNNNLALMAGSFTVMPVDSSVPFTVPGTLKKQTPQSGGTWVDAVVNLSQANRTLEKELKKANTAIAELNKADNELRQQLTSFTKEAVAKLTDDIKDGTVVAQKSIMLKARDDNHWLKHHSVDQFNKDIFQLFRASDAQWFRLITVNSSDYFDVPYAELKKIHSGCHGYPASIDGRLECGSAIHGWCMQRGYAGGFPQESSQVNLGFVCVR